MKWSCSRQLLAPFPSLPRQAAPYSSTLNIRTTLASDADNQAGRANRWLRELSGDDTLSVNAETRWTPEQLPPPWHHLRWQEDEAGIDNAVKAEVLYGLRLIAKKALGDQPYRADDALDLFAGRPEPQSLVREALFFAFFDKPELFASRGILGSLLGAIKEVIFERGQLSRRNTKSVLIGAAFALLDRVQQLRAELTLEGMEQLWRDFEASGGYLPVVTCGIVFWGEAAYRLSERGDMDGARRLLAKQSQALRTLVERLPGLDSSDLMAGMWCHHLGRLAYYRGDMADALKLFGEEWRFHERLDEANRSRLYRSCANVLTDMGFLIEAENLTRQACRAQEHADEPELYKTYGRLAEILAREGRCDEAKTAYEQSWQAQQNKAGLDAQTLVYLGHVHVLLNDFNAAERWYRQAEEQEASAFNPYLCMGRAALFSRNRQFDGLAFLWRQHGAAIRSLQGVKVLPKAVIEMARFNAGQVGNQALLDALETLLAEQYWLEACYFLPVLYPQPHENEPKLKTIKKRLEDWCRVAHDFLVKSRLTDNGAATDYFSLPNLLHELGQAMTNQHWQNTPYIKQIYPFKLLDMAATQNRP